MDVCVSKLQDIIGRSPQDSTSLIAVLQDIQREFNYLPREALTETARVLDVPLSKVYGAATFYNAFSLTPRGERVIRVCQGTACHIKGADLIVEQLEDGLGIRTGETSSDMKYTLEAVNCVGVCAMAPVVVLNNKINGNIRSDKVIKLVTKD
jgi:NADH-quinone oxidoreductase subunit E